MRRGAIGLDADDGTWEMVQVPGHWRNHPKFADQRWPAALPPSIHGAGAGIEPPPVGDARRSLLPGRRVPRRRLPGRRRGLLHAAHVRHHRVVAIRRRARARRRGDVHAATRCPQQAQHHRRVPALGWHRPQLEPRRTVAPGAPLRHRPGSGRSVLCAVPRRRLDAGACALLRPPRLRRPPPCPRPHARRRPSDRRIRTVARRRAQRRQLEPRHREPGAVVAAFARRPAVDGDVDRGDRRRRVERPAETPDRATRGGLERMGVLGQRRAVVPERRQPAADAGRTRRRHSGRDASRHRARGRRRARRAASPQPHRPASAVRRGRRAGHAVDAGLPIALGVREKRARPGSRAGPGSGRPARPPSRRS